ncbi:hypothetical protein [Flavobacterium xueshanense]|uniref:Uncharacterized protein n=1 Tax=Flavobacterium xueshanense TaxID=935223 RepID=A0A1I2DRX9_9FLAO|nr:hypothetical protein [Flavobacterium xueshanense]SFE83218.1 hypothetical protein SAMN04488131_104172 [Flavobacterium xueshanense]
MNINKLILFLLIPISCFSQINSEKYIIDDDGIIVEKFEESNQNDNKYNVDNKIYTVGKSFVFSYYYQNVDGKKFLIAKGKEIKKENYSIFDWKFIEVEKQNEETVKNVILKPILGNPFKDNDPDFNQTGISYEYPMNNNRSLTMEVTGAIENEMNAWIHPPRGKFFQILEINPFPYIKTPYEIGNKWNWKLEIGDHWSDKRWLEWKGGIENNYEYEIIDKKNILTKLGNLDCYIVKANAKSRIGETELVSYYNPTFGFVKLEYKNIDGSKTILELEKVE